MKNLSLTGHFEKVKMLTLKVLFPKRYKETLLCNDVKKYYLNAVGKKLNLRRPEIINEKLWWLALYWQHPLVVKCADKYLAREYVKECGCEEILVPLYGVYNNADEINFDALPLKFVFQCNHGCGYNILCENKSKIDIDAIKKQLNEWLSEKYGVQFYEFHYSKIEPKIICVKYLDFYGKKSLTDYKIHCINGAPIFFLVCTERDHTNHSLVLNSYSLEWEKLPFLKKEGNADIDKPELLNEMIEYARKLSKPFPYVRLDFYIVENKLYIGEFTFTPYGNNMTYYKDSTLEMMGKLLKLPKKYRC